jgi:hypothetical protein
MSTAISARVVRYIKLGWGGEWEKECLEKGIARLGFGTEQRSRFRWCSEGDWAKLKKKLETRFTNQVRLFFEDDGRILWITFHGDRMYWGFLDPSPAESHPDGVGVWRTVVGGWRCDDLKGLTLTKDRLSRRVTKFAQWPGTSCKVTAADYVIRQINGKMVPPSGKRGDAPGESVQGVEDSVVAARQKKLVKSNSGISRQPDPLRRQKIEEAAISKTTDHYTNLRYVVDSVEGDNVGWDLNAAQSTRQLKLEVKGLSGCECRIELTPNEYAKMKQHRDLYRVCVVTNALTSPVLSIFAYSQVSKRWQDEAGRVLQTKDVVAARCWAE